MIKEELKKDISVIKDATISSFLVEYPKKAINYNTQQTKQIKNIANNPKFEKSMEFDKLVAFIALLLLWPAYIFLSILIYIKMPGPVLFTQKRVGQHGELFKIYKLRTMRINNSSSTITIKGENRITPFGIFLRRYKIDEFPALWNVLKGEMSLVGPRPDVPGYADVLEGENRLILKLKPGITSPATLKYSHEEEILANVNNPQEYNDAVIYPDKVKMNLDYFYTRTFIGDIKIITNTIFRTDY
jgi:lipopolysaccharide/colanic/teichoic acid biosynthesis glycosyltransferase